MSLIFSVTFSKSICNNFSLYTHIIKCQAQKSQIYHLLVTHCNYVLAPTIGNIDFSYRRNGSHFRREQIFSLFLYLSRNDIDNKKNRKFRYRLPNKQHHRTAANPRVMPYLLHNPRIKMYLVALNIHIS